MFERVLKVRLVEFMEKQGVLVPGQYGFRTGCSTMMGHSTTMAILVERVRGVWSRGNVTLGVFIDLKKAFDTVDHRILLAILKHSGVKEGAPGLLSRELPGGKSQYVVYGGRSQVGGRLNWESRRALSPFFLIYVNDMVRVSRDLGFVLFAIWEGKWGAGRARQVV